MGTQWGCKSHSKLTRNEQGFSVRGRSGIFIGRSQSPTQVIGIYLEYQSLLFILHGCSSFSPFTMLAFSECILIVLHVGSSQAGPHSQQGI